jgi:hypothetical protein
VSAREEALVAGLIASEAAGEPLGTVRHPRPWRCRPAAPLEPCRQCLGVDLCCHPEDARGVAELGSYRSLMNQDVGRTEGGPPMVAIVGKQA